MALSRQREAERSHLERFRRQQVSASPQGSVRAAGATTPPLAFGSPQKVGKDHQRFATSPSNGLAQTAPRKCARPFATPQAAWTTPGGRRRVRKLDFVVGAEAAGSQEAIAELRTFLQERFPSLEVAFQRLDETRNGVLTFAEFCGKLQELGAPCSDFALLWRQLDVRGTGILTLGDFLRLDMPSSPTAAASAAAAAAMAGLGMDVGDEAGPVAAAALQTAALDFCDMDRLAETDARLAGEELQRASAAAAMSAATSRRHSHTEEELAVIRQAAEAALRWEELQRQRQSRTASAGGTSGSASSRTDQDGAVASSATAAQGEVPRADQDVAVATSATTAPDEASLVGQDGSVAITAMAAPEEKVAAVEAQPVAAEQPGAVEPVAEQALQTPAPVAEEAAAELTASTTNTSILESQCAGCHGSGTDFLGRICACPAGRSFGWQAPSACAPAKKTPATSAPSSPEEAPASTALLAAKAAAPAKLAPSLPSAAVERTPLASPAVPSESPAALLSRRSGQSSASGSGVLGSRLAGGWGGTPLPDWSAIEAMARPGPSAPMPSPEVEDSAGAWGGSTLRFPLLSRTASSVTTSTSSASATSTAPLVMPTQPPPSRAVRSASCRGSPQRPESQKEALSSDEKTAKDISDAAFVSASASTRCRRSGLAGAAVAVAVAAAAMAAAAVAGAELAWVLGPEPEAFS
eukprot:TRINITY_DN4102_c0_g1_i1.p1 TRINITY_DN4102_c0_g1~~TRINITY_DN4102_c0_g1_i1.p1  ORF type:complete len:695 (+),score=173.36 TRINITY_DN4102_c0_g1_i1:66-2150(+)